ncbi:MAG TPA: chemotaxis protein CheA [Candidatus Angelobacter sp.]|nr:chemotaxis protein CheA [Candidatus Angelobacter sp.]
MEIQRDVILKNFLIESEEGLSLMEQSILELELHSSGSEAIQSIFRVVHTMKGNASLLEIEGLLAFTHTAEDLLDDLRSGKLSVTPEIVTLLLDLVDALRQMVAAAGKGKDETGPGAKDVLARISHLLKLHEKSGKNLDQAKDGQGLHSNLEAASAMGQAPYHAARTLRVDVTKLDRLLDLAGELTIARGRVAQMLEAKEEISLEELRDAHSFADSLHYELQDTILKARMVPVGPLFHQYNRTVRDMAKSLGKMAQLRIEGEDIEVDTSVVEYLKDPLLHMIRNALDHGIEPPAKRKKRGKPQTGTITVRAAREGRNIVIEVTDDGAGLDRQKIIEVAQQKGLIAEPQKLPHQEIYQLIFEPGFTTASQVSDMSGRGVGMDVVRRNIQSLRGSVHATSQPGVGATVRIRLPLTLAIIEGFGVGVGNETYVIPVDQVIECVELAKEDHENARKDGVLQLRDEPLPFIHLKDHFGLPGDRGARQSVVVVQHETSRAGLAVNELYGATQTVIKPLPAIFKDVAGVSGSAILGNGRVALILDIPALFRDFRMQEAHAG